MQETERNQTQSSALLFPSKNAPYGTSSCGSRIKHLVVLVLVVRSFPSRRYWRARFLREIYANLCHQIFYNRHTYLGCSVELHLPENKVALLCHSVFFNVSDKVVLFDSQTQNRAVRTEFHIFTRKKKTLVVVITGIQTVRYLESLGFNSLTTVGVSLSKTP